MAWVPVIVYMVICYVSLSDAEITITAVDAIDANGNLKCGSQVTLMCKIQPYNGTMVWKADNASMMSCTSGACQTIPPYHPNYGFSFERENGIFNITIHPVKFEENGRLFECNDGSTSQLLTTSVRLLPENSTTFLTAINSTNATKNVELKVTTGCVYPADSVQFEWLYYKEGEDPIPYTFGDQVDGPANDSTTDCTSGDCGGDEVKQLESTLTFEHDDEGEDFFFQAVVKSTDTTDTIVLNVNSTYKFKVSGRIISTVFSGLGTKVGLVVTLALIGVVIVVITVIIFVVLVARSKNDPEKHRILGN
ncbi:uncharacterized protein LOC132746726 [Ruditapes philippinarum]|uniref:uncharacterized protein LOC132746726 n=1 Tax=Ruditapes philippinarum TaxID=129788 RepID=UPI00295A6A9C|nr:uncharacterized protein LOC132746726 [Ruditapes philippinarum]